jgi:alkylhydroperoxidase family enzyme
MQPRIEPAQPPFPAEVQAWLDTTMRGNPPLMLFTVLARDTRLFGKFFSAGLLDRGHLTVRQREIVIDRTTALCRSEYEWGVHLRLFAARAGLDDAQIQSLSTGSADDPCWSEPERCLIRLCDALHASCTIDDVLWDRLKSFFADEALLELLMLAGFYRTVSYLTNALRLPLESGSVPLPPGGGASQGPDAGV